MKIIIIVLGVLLATFGFIYSEHTRSASADQASTLTLSGSIEQGFRYKVIVEYVATKDSFWCKYYPMSPFTYTRASSRRFEYYPVIENGQHRITLPLSEYSPDKGCRYRPFKVNYSLAPDSQTLLNKNGLFSDPQYLPGWSEEVSTFDNLDDYAAPQPKVLNRSCYPFMQSARLKDDPNKHWNCYPADAKERITLTSDFPLGKGLELILNMRAVSEKEYRQSCYYLSLRDKKCQ
jgi:hypothetical protein